MEVNNRPEFMHALETGNFAEAESWLLKKRGEVQRLAGEPAMEDGSWTEIDHLERFLFRALHQSGRYTDAKRIVEDSTFESSKVARRKRLEQVAGQPYDEI